MVTQKDFAFYSTEIDPTVDPASADPAPNILVVLDQPPILGDGMYDFQGGEIGRGSVIPTLGGAVIQDFGVVAKDGRISFSESDALSQPVVTDLKTIHEVVDGEYYFTDGFNVWTVRFIRPGGFVYRKNLYWAQHGQSVYSYEINLIIISQEI